MVNDHTRSAENWKSVWYLLRLYIYIYIRVYVDSHSLGQLALASKRTASICIYYLCPLPDPDVGLSILVCDVEHTSFHFDMCGRKFVLCLFGQCMSLLHMP